MPSLPISEPFMAERWPTRLALAAIAVLACAMPSWAQPTVQPAGPAWKVEPPFAKNAEARKALSGAACAPTSPPVCLVANDEKKYAQFFSIKDKTLVPSTVIRLVPDKEDGFEFDELDTEGIAYDGGYFYVVGSHGAPRKPDKPLDPSRFFLFRFKVDTQSGLPDFKLDGEVPVDPKSIEKKNTLREVIKAAPQIGAFAEKPLSQNGANVEGIAVKGERIFLGFRGPSVGDNAFILSVDRNGVFGGGAMNPKVDALALGKDIGIRDLAPLKSGMLVLAGPAPDAAGTYAIAHWNEQTNALKPLAKLAGIPAGGKAETLIVLEDNEQAAYRVLVLIESIENGHPLEYVVAR